MTSWNLNYCGPFNRSGHMHHMIDPDADGNAMCVRPGCGHASKIVCTCLLDEDYTKYIGRPTHTSNPRMKWYPGSGIGVPDEPAWGLAMRWMPDSLGGELSDEEAELLSRELVRKERR